MPSLRSIAPRDRAYPLTVVFKADDGERFEVHVEYFKNRISLAPMKALVTDEEREELSEAELDAYESASTLCHYLKSWDLEGPLEDYEGNVIVGEEETIPLKPGCVQYVSTPVIGEIMSQLTDAVFPNRTPSRRERRRSR